MRRLLWVLVSGLSGLVIWLALFFIRPLPLPHTPYVFELPSGLGLRAVAQQLVQKGVLPEPWTFTWVGRVLGEQSHLKAGSYEWLQPLTGWQMLRQMARGEGDAWQVQIIEGTTFAQLRALLAQQPSLRQDSAGLSDSAVMAHLGAAGQSPEGWFFPDTYFYNPGESDWSILERAHRAMSERLAQVWATRDPHLALTDPYQALILASLIEKETANREERARISAVFLNRLRLDMRLQTDPTVIYGLGTDYDGHLHHRDLHRDSAYNTYTRSGLPPTPIALPGAAALQAAVHPLAVPDLFFVARGDGTHQFSTTLEAHQQAVQRYQTKRMTDHER